MATLHGWINLGTANKSTIATLESLEKEHAIHSKIFGQNGEVSCSFFTCRNHYGRSFDNLYDKLEKIINEEPDTYGLIHIYDDEHTEFYDTWQVWVIRKGKIEKKEDTFLSPLSEKVFIDDEERFLKM